MSEEADCMSIIIPVVFMVAVAMLFGVTTLASSKDKDGEAQTFHCAGCHMAGNCPKTCIEKED